MRIAFKMKLNKGNEGEYKTRHNPIWAEFEETILEHGVKTYSIFHDKETDDLFAYAEIEDLKRWEEIGKTLLCKKWWHYMAPLMEVNEDKSPVSKKLEEVFHIEK